MSIEPERRLSEMNWRQILWLSRDDLSAKQRKVQAKIAVENDRENLAVLNRAWWVCEFAIREKDAKDAISKD